MSHNLTLFQSISAKFKLEVQDVLGGTNYEYIYDNDPNANPDPPQSPTSAGTKGYLVVSLLPGEAHQVSIGIPGNNRFRQPGVLQVQIYTPSSDGDKTTLEIADIVCNAFRSKNEGGVIYKTPYPKVFGTSGAWWRIDVICPWHSDYFG